MLGPAVASDRARRIAPATRGAPPITQLPNYRISQFPPLSDLPYASATDLAARIRRRDVSAVDVLDAFLDRIRALNGRINAVVTLDAEGARRRAEAADRALRRGRVWGPLHGVPITVKDQFSTAGLRTTYGLPPYRNWIPEADAPTVARLRRAGAVLMGKTNLPLAAYDWQCLHPNFGRTHNPWAEGYTPGGSSGGSAAALSAGLSALELGADVGGSIRLPSHFCGVCGLRPTDGLLPLDGMVPSDRPMTVQSIVVPGPMARSVADLQTALDVLRTPVSAPLSDAGPPLSPDPGDLRVAITPDLGGVPVDTDTARVLRSVADTLRGAGCTVDHRPPPFDIDDALDVWGRIQGYELSAGLPALVRRTPLKRLVWDGAVRFLYGFLADGLSRGSRLDSRGYMQAVGRRRSLTQRVDRYLREWDVWITPVAAIPSFAQCRTGAELRIEGEPVPYALPFAAYLPALAVPGHPVLTLPVGFTRPRDGRHRLPIAVQVHGRPGHDARLLAAGRTLERIVGDPGRFRPPDGEGKSLGCKS